MLGLLQRLRTETETAYAARKPGTRLAATTYAVVSQSGQTQGLVTAKARLAKQGLTIPRQELFAGHMAANLVTNVKEALEGFPVANSYCWLDSTVALHWIRDEGNYKQFVQNRVNKIQQKNLEWRYVPTHENPADLGSRGGAVTQTYELWWYGPKWLSKPEKWPENVSIRKLSKNHLERLRKFMNCSNWRPNTNQMSSMNLKKSC